MPEPSQQAAQQVEDPYDLGNTEPGPLTPKSTAEPEPEPQPRGDDGRFQHKHPQYLRDAAADLGLTDDAISGIETARLSQIVVQGQRRVAAIRAEQARAQDHQQAAVKQPNPAEDRDDLLDLGTDENGEPVKESDFHPSILRMMRRQADEIRKLRGTVKETTERETQRQQSALSVALDEAFDSLGEGDHALFGNGSITEISPTEAKRRNAVFAAAGITANDGPRAIARKIKAAREELFPAAPAPAAPATPATQDYELPEPAKNGKAPRITKDQWNAGGLTKPTQRNADDLPPGDEKARRAVAARLAQESRASDSEELEGLPD